MPSARRSAFVHRARALTLVLRIVYSLLAAFFIRIPLDHDAALATTNATWTLYTPADGWRYLLLGPWQRYDALWYDHIATAGYDRAKATVFYPLYPILMRTLHALLPFAPTILCGLLISTVAAFFVFWGLQELADDESRKTAALRGLLLFALWPTGFILFAGYAEALLLALMVWSIWFGRRNQWWLAGFLGLLAGLTKATGCLVAIPLLLCAWRTNRNYRSAPALLPAFAYPLYQLWLHRSGFPASTEVYRQDWHTTVSMPWITLIDGFRQFHAEPGWVLGASLVATLLVLAGSFFLRRELALFCWAVIAFFLLKHTDPIMQSSMRYSMIAFPVFIAAGRFTHLITVPLTTFFLLLNVACLFLVVHWGLII